MHQISLYTCPVNGLVAQHIVESKCPVTLNRGRDDLSFTSCNDSGVIVNDTGWATALSDELG